MTETVNIEITPDEAVELVELLRAEAVAARALGDNLILQTANTSAGYNQYARSDNLTALSERIEALIEYEED